MASDQPPFHLALRVQDLDQARSFYRDLLGCAEGRSAERWVDLDLEGHQLSLHLAPPQGGPAFTNKVDGHDVPVPHFGLVLRMERWRAMATRLAELGVEFVIEPYVRFEGLPGEQGTFFLRDPFDNVLEFKGFPNEEGLFAPQKDEPSG